MIDDSDEGNIMDFIRALTIQNVGECKVSEGEFEEVVSKVDEQQQDFALQEDDAIDITEKEAFTKSIGLGPEKKAPIIQSPPSLLIGKCTFSFGHNPGSSTLTLIDGKLCKALGVNILLEDQIYSGHNYEITYLYYDKINKILISGTQGKCSEIRLWMVEKAKQKIKLSQHSKTYLPLNSLGVAFAWLQNPNTLAIITRCSLHASSQLFVVNLQDMKRNRCQSQLGKVRMANFSQSCLLLNEKGLFELKISEEGNINQQYLIEESIGCTFTVLKYQKTVVMGCLNGNISVVNRKRKNCINSGNSHQKQVLSIIELKDRQFITSGIDKKIILFEIDEQIQKINKLRILELSSPCYNLMVHCNSLFCSLRTTEIIRILCNQQNQLKIISDPISQAITYHSFPNSGVKPHLVYNKYMKKYIYAISGSPHISILNVDERGNLASAKKVTLCKPLSQLDCHGSIIAYVFDEEENQNINSFKSQLSGFFKKQNSKVQEELILEDFTKKNVVGRLPLTEQTRCARIKFNEDGDKVILGFKNGKISLYYVNKPEHIVLLRTSELHAEAITDLIWSKGGTVVKSISKTNVIYLDVMKDKEQMIPIYTSKGLKETEWSTCGKFDWKNFHVWNNHLHVPSDITDIKETEEYMLVCMSEGSLKAFRNPAWKQYQQLIRLFNKQFICSVVREGEDRFNVVFASGGSIFCLEIGDFFSSEGESQEISFEEVEDK